MFSSLFGKKTPGLPQSGCMTPRQRQPVTDEVGEWLYIVVDPKGIAPRSQPSYDKDSKAGLKLQEGELVRVVEKKPLAHSSTCFLRLAEGGWCFDVQPQGDCRLRMVEVQLEEYNKVYMVLAKKGVGIRGRPSFLQSAIVCRGPEEGEYFATCQRIVFGDTTFLRLADGSGWVFDQKNGKRILEGPVKDLPQEIVQQLGPQFFADDTSATENAPITDEVSRQAAGQAQSRTQLMVKLWQMGFRNASLNQEALRISGGDVDAAAEWLLMRQQADNDENNATEKAEFAPPPRVAVGSKEPLGEIQASDNAGKDAGNAGNEKVFETSDNAGKDEIVASEGTGSTLPSSGGGYRSSTEMGKGHLDGYRNHLQKDDSPAGATKPQDMSKNEDSKIGGAQGNSESDEECDLPEEGPVHQATSQRLSRRDHYTEGGRKRDPSRKRSKSAGRRQSQDAPIETDQKDLPKDDDDFDDDCCDVDEGTGDGGSLRVKTVRGGVDATQRGTDRSNDATSGKTSKRIRGRTPRQRRESEPSSTSDAAKVATPRGSKGAGKSGAPKRRASSRRRASSDEPPSEVQE